MATIIVREENLEVNLAVEGEQLWAASSAVARMMDTIQMLHSAEVRGIIRIAFDPKEED